MKSEAVPENFHDIFASCFGEEVPKISANCRFIRTATSWLVYQTAWKPEAVILYAGTIPVARNQGLASSGFREALFVLQEEGYTEFQMSTRRKNLAPQIIALKNGFLFAGSYVGDDDQIRIIWRKK